MPKNFKTSQSKVKTHRKCKRAYYNKYELKLRRKRVARPLMFGRIVHQMIEEYANAGDPFAVLKRLEREDAKMFRAEREEYGEIVDDIRVIMTEYFEHWKRDDLTYARLRGKASEHTFEIEIDDGILWTGKIDNVGLRKKLRWLVEHKSFKRKPSTDHRWRDLQSVTYIRAIDILGLKPVDGVCWDYIHSKPPAYPQLLQNGSISKKRIYTLPTRVLEAARDQNLSSISVESLTRAATQNRREYFDRVYTPVKANVVDKVFNDFVETSREMADSDGKRAMTIDRHCDWCEFEPLCRAELQGLDVDFIRKKEYERREKAEEFEPDFEA